MQSLHEGSLWITLTVTLKTVLFSVLYILGSGGVVDSQYQEREGCSGYGEGMFFQDCVHH